VKLGDVRLVFWGVILVTGSDRLESLSYGLMESLSYAVYEIFI